jgi:hypothetical protein
MNITTQYPNAWNESLYSILSEDFKIEKGELYVKISKKDETQFPLVVRYYYIYVQIGHGWIK